MASYTEHLELLKKDPVADGADTFNIQTMLNDNWDKIDDAVSKKADLGEGGKIPASQLPEMNYDPAGSAAAVQTSLTAHINNKNNPHGVTPAQIGAQTALGFTPVQQGGGVNQLSNKVRIGWTGTTLDLTVDNSNMGSFLLSGTPKSAILPASRGGTGVRSIAELASLLAGQGIGKIATGSYQGTETAGEGNPNTVTCPFPIKIFAIMGYTDTDLLGVTRATLCGIGYANLSGTSYNSAVMAVMHETDYLHTGFGHDGYTKFSADKKTVYWYDTQKNYQFNDDHTYYWVAFG